ncbi:MAG: hypothetical protein KJ804_19510 [Proteobacteria bacterium]|nr:hypothetical protein [Pseudomonadota bacterium]MBU1060496.1 hypothetical protein [Pseudomonadota bacterium]
MTRNNLLIVFVLFLFVFGGFISLANARGANAPSSRGMSILDGVPTEAGCRICHDDLIKYPMLSVTNLVKHHSDITSSADCLACHTIWDETAQTFVFNFTSNCLLCHAEETVTGSPGSFNVHHETTTFAQRDCDACH